MKAPVWYVRLAVAIILNGMWPAKQVLADSLSCAATLDHSNAVLHVRHVLPVHNFQFIVADSKQVFTQQIATL